MKWLRAQGPNVTVGAVWKRCERGDWLLWQLEEAYGYAGGPTYRKIFNKVKAVCKRLTVTAVRRDLKTLTALKKARAAEIKNSSRKLKPRAIDAEWVDEWINWARYWLYRNQRQSRGEIWVAQQEMLQTTGCFSGLGKLAISIDCALSLADFSTYEKADLWDGIGVLETLAFMVAPKERAAERQRHADAIRKSIPEWPG